MALWFAALLGLIQGLTEFIPVSSTAHLRIVPALVGQPDPGAAYTAVIQLGTLMAVLAYFAKDLAHLPSAMFREPGTFEGRLPWLLAVGTFHLVENPGRSQAWVRRSAVPGIGLGLALSLAAAGVAKVGGNHPPRLAKGEPAVLTAEAVAAATDPQAELQRIIAASA